MSTEENIEDDMVQRYLDGDLPDEEAEAVRAMLAEDADEQARLESFERLGDLLRMAADDSMALVDSDALYSRVVLGIRKATGAHRVQVVELQQRNRRVATAGFAALAIAAAATLVYVTSEPGGDAETATPTPDTPPDRDPQHLVVIEEPPGGSEVLEVDFGENTGTVFAVEGIEGEPIAVVWITDEKPP